MSEKVVSAEDAARAKKRAEIMKNLEIARAAQKAKEESAKADATPEAKMFGTHIGITCDGCNCITIVGYRWRCKNCKNHDLCDACYDEFKSNKKLLHVNQRRNPISMRLEDHEFKAIAEPGCFKSMVGAVTTVKKAKQKPNDPCSCGSGKKAKKCCLKK